VLNYVAKEGGIALEQDYPYLSNNDFCRCCVTSDDCIQSVAHIKYLITVVLHGDMGLHIHGPEQGAYTAHAGLLTTHGQASSRGSWRYGSA
jgi:hypothetical protein